MDPATPYPSRFLDSNALEALANELLAAINAPSTVGVVQQHAERLENIKAFAVKVLAAAGLGNEPVYWQERGKVPKNPPSLSRKAARLLREMSKQPDGMVPFHQLMTPVTVTGHLLLMRYIRAGDRPVVATQHFYEITDEGRGALNDYVRSHGSDW